tara:strand:- start:2612 stop:2914 length:303 start_codon:yes stop_codon:yes gene_type:complete
MPLQQIVNIFLVLFIIGTLAAIFVLIRDRINIIRSIKPNTVKDFFAYDDDTTLIDYIFRSLSRYRNPLLKIIINIFGLIIWVPFWLLDKYFKLNIFENKK